MTPSNHMPRLKWEFDVSSLLTILVLVAGMFITYGQIGSRLSNLEEKSKDMKEEIRMLRTELVNSKIEIAGLSAQLAAARAAR